MRRGSEAERRQQAIAVSGGSTPGRSPQEWKAPATLLSERDEEADMTGAEGTKGTRMETDRGCVNHSELCKLL